MRQLRIVLMHLVAACSVSALSHPANTPTAVAKVRVDGSFEVAIRFDVLAFALDEEQGHVNRSDVAEFFNRPASEIDASLREASARFLSEFKVKKGEVVKLAFPSSSETRKWQGSNRSSSPVMLTATVKGKLSRGSKDISFRFPERLGKTVLVLEFPYWEPISGPVEPGSYSTAQRLPTRKEVAASAASMLKRSSPDKPSKPKTKKP